MCGIAGYSISKSHAERVSNEKFLDALEAGIRLNIHRGQDACGFFAALPSKNDDSASTWFWKKSGSGVKNIKEICKFLENGHNLTTPTVLGLHTRAKSVGFSELDNGNNHPVIYNDVLTIHNGMVRNHLQLKKLDIIPESKYGKTHPQVDSLTISMLFSAISNPYEADPKNIAKLLSMLKGGWAFHTVWREYPGISLLVAGPEYPLTVRVGNNRLGYSSEPEAVTAMFDIMGLPWSSKGKIREMDTGTFMMLDEGVPVYYGKYDSEGKDYSKRLADAGYRSGHLPEWNRRIPVTKDKTYVYNGNTSKKIAGLTTSNSYNSDNIAPWSSTIVDPNDLVAIYDKQHGVYFDESKHIDVWTALSASKSTFEKVKDGAPITALFNKIVFEAIAEADTIFAHRVSNYTCILYAWIGSTEIVLSDAGTIEAIYNWDVSAAKRYDTNDELRDARRSTIAEKLKDYEPLLELETSSEKFISWTMRNSINATETKKLGVVGGGSNIVPFKNGASAPISNGPSKPQIKRINEDNSASFILEELEKAGAIFENKSKVWTLPIVALYESIYGMSVGMADYKNVIYRHNRAAAYENLCFFVEDICPIHYEYLGAHETPLDCEYIVQSAYINLSLARDVKVVEAMYTTAVSSSTNMVKVKSITEFAKCTHDWVSDGVLSVPMYGFDITVPQRDACHNCSAVRSITRWPKFIQDYINEIEAVDGEIISTGVWSD